MTLGRSGHKTSAGIRRSEGMPVMINDDTSSHVTTPDSKNASPVISHMSDATTLVLTPEGPKKVKSHDPLTAESSGIPLSAETLKAKDRAHVLGATSSSSLKRSSASSSGDGVRVNVSVTINDNDEGAVVKRRRRE